MLKINYPKNGSPDFLKFIEEYKNIFSSGIDEMQRRLDIILKKPKFSKVIVKKVNEILVLDFERLIELNDSFLKCNPTSEEVNTIKGILNYDGRKKGGGKQSRIAKFFLKNQDVLKIKTCYFCNLEYINPFVDVADYYDAKDLLNTAHADDLAKVYSVTKDDAKAIIRLRGLSHGFRFYKSVRKKLGKNKFKNIKKMNFNSNRYYFTLDHVLDKGSNPLSALSLFNLVPSCYSCNSKFKGSKVLVKSLNDAKLSPTCSKFDFSLNNKFVVGFASPLVNYSLIKDINDFTIKLDIPEKEKGYCRYETIFRLNARYKEHKEDILDLISNKEKYPTSHIRFIARLTKAPFDDVKKSIFGEELSLKASDLNRKPKAKLKVDIARQLKI